MWLNVNLEGISYICGSVGNGEVWDGGFVFLESVGGNMGRFLNRDFGVVGCFKLVGGFVFKFWFCKLRVIVGVFIFWFFVFVFI